MFRTMALTGSTGFIGTAVLRSLAQAGWRIRALCRKFPSGALPWNDGGAVEWVCGRLEDAESLDRLVRGAEVVVHCAGAIRGACADDFRRVNVEGVARLVQAARAVHPWPRFLLMSSLAAREPQLSHYAASKRAGEDALRSAAGGMPWTVLRPPAVYGPGDRETLPLVRCMQRGVSPVFGQKGSRFSLIFVKDLAAAVARLAESAPWSSACFDIHDGRTGGYTWEELIQTVSRIIQKPVRLLRIPRVVLQAAARGNLLVARAAGYAPLLTPGKVRELTHPDWVCTEEALRHASGWSPRFLLEAGMRQTLQHLRKGRWVAG